MYKTVEAMKQALKEFDTPILADEFEQAMRLRKACDALRQAIEQAEQDVDWEAIAADQAMTIAMLKQREWVGLTDKDIKECDDLVDPLMFRDEAKPVFARAIEIKLKEKNT